MRKQLHIGIQAWYLAELHTGIGQHTMGLSRGLLEKNQKLTLVVPKPVRVSGLSSRIMHVLKPKWWIPHRSLKKWYWEKVQVPAYFAKLNPDWEYYPYPCPLPRYSPNMRAMTVHDTILWNDERYFGGPLKSWYHHLTRCAVSDVDQVFGVSQATLKSLGLPTAALLYNGQPQLPRGLRVQKNPKQLVYLGGYDIRKQVPKLLIQFGKLREKYPEYELVLIGKPHHVSRYYPMLPYVEGVRFLGELTDKKVYETLKGAFAFVHFSDAEGFNLPLLQAMAVGTPAVVRDLPVNREISQESALFMNPKKSDTLLTSIKQLRRKPTYERIAKKQQSVARQYTWKKTAQDFLKALKDSEA